MVIRHTGPCQPSGGYPSDANINLSPNKAKRIGPVLQTTGVAFDREEDLYARLGIPSPAALADDFEGELDDEEFDDEEEFEDEEFDDEEDDEEFDDEELDDEEFDDEELDDEDFDDEDDENEEFLDDEDD